MLVYVEGGGGPVSDLTSKDTPGRLQEHWRLLERLRYIEVQSCTCSGHSNETCTHTQQVLRFCNHTSVLENNWFKIDFESCILAVT